MRQGFGRVLLVLAVLAAKPAVASSCRASCVDRMAACRAEQCSGATGTARRQCRDVCRATTGCAAGAARIRTLATVVTECRSGLGGFTLRQRLEIRRGDCAPVTVMELATPVPAPDSLNLCELYGLYRSGFASVIVGAFQRHAVSTDGRLVVFQVTDDHAYAPFAPPAFTLPEKGIFLVRADGSGLRSLGPPSREASFRVIPTTFPPGFQIWVNSGFVFSPNGRLVVFADRGPGVDGSDAAQLVTLDVKTGERKQVTAFVAASQGDPRGNVDGFFVDDDTIQGYAFDVTTDARFFTVKADGSDFRRFAPPVPIPGSQIVPTFQLANRARDVQVFDLPATTSEPFAGPVRELFVGHGTKALQLTSFGRSDTLAVAASRDGKHIFFAASADPFGRNPLNVCQLFSIDRFAGHLRELTAFQAAGKSPGGCGTPIAPPSCRIEIPIHLDTRTHALVFGASCDPFGTNSLAGNIFSVRTDGSGLRQLTSYRGMVFEPDGTVSVELPGPIEYSDR